MIQLLILACLWTAPPSDTTLVSFASNGYAYPGGSTRTFFLPATAGELRVVLLVASARRDSRLTVRLDSTGQTYTMAVPRGATRVPVGTFSVSGGRYHYIEVSGAVEALALSGPAAAGLRCNLSEYRGAPATHLGYPIPKDSAAEWFYSEISVPVGAEPGNAYYMVDGFSGGYFGIQVNGPRERHILFSVWSNYNTNDPREIPADYSVTLVKKGEGVTAKAFGNEGSGGQSFWNFMWKPETTYRLLVRARPAGDHTLYSAWFYAPERKAWKFLATWDKTKTGGQQLKGLYSFVENFGDNGNDFFKARYGNQWIRTPAGTWIELTEARFTTTASPKVHQRYDYGGGTEGNWFYQFSGGYKEVGDVQNGSVIRRPGGNTPPDVDLGSLPED